MIREFSKMQVPDFISGDVSSYVDALPMTALHKLINGLRELRVDHRQLESEALPMIGEGGHLENEITETEITEA
jgi:hypothetical protein